MMKKYDLWCGTGIVVLILLAGALCVAQWDRAHLRAPVQERLSDGEMQAHLNALIGEYSLRREAYKKAAWGKVSKHGSFVRNRDAFRRCVTVVEQLTLMEGIIRSRETARERGREKAWERAHAEGAWKTSIYGRIYCLLHKGE